MVLQVRFRLGSWISQSQAPPIVSMHALTELEHAISEAPLILQQGFIIITRREVSTVIPICRFNAQSVEAYNAEDVRVQAHLQNSVNSFWHSQKA